jgi:hypothetical protein
MLCPACQSVNDQRAVVHDWEGWLKGKEEDMGSGLQLSRTSSADALVGNLSRNLDDYLSDASTFSYGFASLASHECLLFSPCS